MNTNTFLETSTRKRTFVAYEPSLSIMTRSEEGKATEAALINQDDSNRDAKKSRNYSPVPDVLKAMITNASKVDLPLLPTIPDSVRPIITETVLPDPKESNAEPDEYLLLLVKALHGVDLKVQNGLELGGDYFKPITDAQQAAYTMEVLTPARDNDINALKALVEKEGPQAVNCLNRFGESLLHLACRRGFLEIAEFLLSAEINLDVRLKDDFGRTPLHDACWHSKPQLVICGWLIKRDPSLLLVTDKRGNTPFQYARAEDYGTWRQFLFDNRDSLQLLTEPSTLKQFC